MSHKTSLNLLPGLQDILPSIMQQVPEVALTMRLCSRSMQEVTDQTLSLKGRKLKRIIAPPTSGVTHSLKPASLKESLIQLKTLAPDVASHKDLIVILSARDSYSSLERYREDRSLICLFQALPKEMQKQFPSPQGFTSLQVYEKAALLRVWFREKDFSGVTEIDLRNKKLVTLPPELAKFSKLQRLNINGNMLSKLPDCVFQLTELTELKASKNQLQSLSPAIARLQNLKTLDISKNALKTLPVELETLEQIESFNVSYNQLTTLPASIGNFSQLDLLDISHNKISSLPDIFTGFRKLNAFFCSQNALTRLPPSLALVESLLTIDLSRNKFTAIPLQLAPHRNLESLNLSFNPLENFTYDFSGHTNLEFLQLAGTSLTLFPPDLALPDSLSCINLSCNNLEELPEKILRLPGLKILNLEKNGIQVIDIDLLKNSSIAQILLNNNAISSIPPSLVDLFLEKGIEVILDGNPLNVVRSYKPKHRDALMRVEQKCPLFEGVREGLSNMEALCDFAMIFDYFMHAPVTKCAMQKYRLHYKEDPKRHISCPFTFLTFLLEGIEELPHVRLLDLLSNEENSLTFKDLEPLCHEVDRYLGYNATERVLRKYQEMSIRPSKTKGELFPSEPIGNRKKFIDMLEKELFNEDILDLIFHLGGIEALDYPSIHTTLYALNRALDDDIVGRAFVKHNQETGDHINPHAITPSGKLSRPWILYTHLRQEYLAFID